MTTIYLILSQPTIYLLGFICSSACFGNLILSISGSPRVCMSLPTENYYGTNRQLWLLYNPLGCNSLSTPMSPCTWCLVSPAGFTINWTHSHAQTKFNLGWLCSTEMLACRGCLFPYFNRWWFIKREKGILFFIYIIKFSVFISYDTWFNI